MKLRCIKIILKTKDEDKVFSFKAKKLPEINEEIVLFYNGANRFIKVEQVNQKPFPQIFASEVENESPRY
jgi:hypothetical protein